VTEKPTVAAKDLTETATLSRELGELLVQLSIAVHRFAMYPPGHPSLQPAAEGVLDRLNALLSDRDMLAIGVAQQQLIIEGVATDEKHPVLRDLAKRLHEHQLGALSFDEGVMLWEIEDALATLAMDAEHSGKPIGILPKDDIPDWTHLHLFGVGYTQLRLSKDEADNVAEGELPTSMDLATELWLGLARAAISSEEAFAEGDAPAGEMPSGGEVAQQIGKHRREAAYDQVIVGYLMKLTTELKDGSGKEAEQVRQRVSQLIDTLDSETLADLVKMGGDQSQKKQFLLNASEGLAADSVIKVLKAAAESEGQTISTSMTRLLSKLAVHSNEGGGLVRHQADSALSESVEELMADWELKDPNPDSYTLVLDSLSKAVPNFGDEYVEMDEGGLTGAQRIVEMALEVEAYGPIVEKALSDVMSAGDTGFLIELIEEAPDVSEVASRMRGHMTSPAQLRKLLSGETVDVDALAIIVDKMGASAFDPLLDVLTESDSRSVRRAVFDLLATRVDEVGDRVVNRLEDSRWFVLRNLLSLIQKFHRLPDAFDARDFLNHPDARVRREVLPLAMRQPNLRERSLAGALGDEDGRMVRMALAELGEGIPETLVPTVVNRVVKGDHPEDLKVLGIRALGGSSSSLALDTLADLAQEGKTLLGRVKLAPKSRELIAALRSLGTHWSGNPRAQTILGEAARSKDIEVSRAARTKTPNE
jgi:hypothetical protein